MSTLDINTLNTISNIDVYNSHSPKNFEEALTEFTLYCNRQLPKSLNIIFTPTCFDITSNELFAVLGDDHGNVANLELSTNKVLRDEEICAEFKIENLKLALQDKQVVLTNSNFEVLLLEYPSFSLLFKFHLYQGPISCVFCLDNNRAYFSNGSNDLKEVQLSVQEDYYTNYFSINTIPQDLKVICLEISKEAHTLALGYENGKIGLMRISNYEIYKITQEYPAQPSVLTLAKHQDFLAAGFEDNVLRVWEGNELKLIHEDNSYSETITGLAFVRENKYLISSSIDMCVRVWDTRVESKPFEMNLDDVRILMMKGGSLDKTVFYICENNQFFIWRVPILPANARYRKHTSKIIKLLFMQDEYELASISENGEVNIWDYRYNTLQSSYHLPGPIIDAKLIYSGQTIIAASGAPAVHLWDLTTGNTETFDLAFTPVAFAISKNEALIAISDQFSRVLLHDFDVMIRKLYIKGHLEPVTCLIFIEDDRFLLTASRDATLAKWSLKDGKRISTMNGHNTAVLNMVVSDQGYIFSASEDGNVIIWSTDCYFLYTLVPPEPEPNIGIYLSSTHDYLITLGPTKVNYWQLQSLSLIFQTDTSYPANSIAINFNEKYVAVAEGNTVYIEENSIECSSLRLVGKNIGSPHKFMRFVLDCQVDSSKAQYDKIHNHWIIAPYLLGPAHILSYCNRFNDLDKALFYDKNRANFFSSRKNENPLTICVEMEYKNCIDICLKYMKMESQDRVGRPRNPRIYVPLESCLTKLNTINYHYIAKLYDSLYISASEAYLPRFCLIETSLPATYLSERFTIYPEYIVDKEFYSSTGRPVVFSQSVFPLDLDLGTYGSIRFLESLLDCNDQTIFRSKIVVEYLNCKWFRIWPASYILGSIYITYLIMLGLHIVILLESKTFLAAIIFVHIVLVLYEILQVATDFGDYWQGIWNILDQLRSISFSFYAIMAWEGQYNTDILLAVLIFSWTRGIACFRIFDSTRYMVRLIIQVIVDITYFFFILFYATVAFAFIYYMRNPDKSFAMYLTVAYRLDLGDFETNITSTFDWGLFFIATMINPLIMLNLLIAIMSDTATAVDEIDDICGSRELAGMIIEIEKVMFWKKHLKHKHFLHKLDFFQVNDEETDKKMEKIRFIKKQTQNLNGSIKSLKGVSHAISRLKVEENLNEIYKKQGEIREEIIEKIKKNDCLMKEIRTKIIIRN